MIFFLWNFKFIDIFELLEKTVEKLLKSILEEINFKKDILNNFHNFNNFTLNYTFPDIF